MQPNLPNIDYSKTTEISCERCQCNLFVERLLLRKASRLITFTDKDAIIPIPVLCCAKCGNVNEDVKPSFLKINKTE